MDQSLSLNLKRILTFNKKENYAEMNEKHFTLFWFMSCFQVKVLGTYSES